MSDQESEHYEGGADAQEVEMQDKELYSVGKSGFNKSGRNKLANEKLDITI